MNINQEELKEEVCGFQNEATRHIVADDDVDWDLVYTHIPETELDLLDDSLGLFK